MIVVTNQLKQYDKVYKRTNLNFSMDLLKIARFNIIFLSGCLVGLLFNLYVYAGIENPIMNPLGLNGMNNKSAPYDFIKENQIEVYPDKIIIKIENASIGRYAPTGSMVPVLDSFSNGIRIVPKSNEEVHVGDIITFNKEDKLIIHRVVEKGMDREGVYFITKGDNNDLNDGKVRFKDISYITVGVIW